MHEKDSEDSEDKMHEKNSETSANRLRGGGWEMKEGREVLPPVAGSEAAFCWDVWGSCVAKKEAS